MDLSTHVEYTSHSIAK